MVEVQLAGLKVCDDVGKGLDFVEEDDKRGLILLEIKHVLEIFTFRS
jgi:hypothetical protein